MSIVTPKDLGKIKNGQVRWKNLLQWQAFQHRFDIDKKDNL